MLRPYSSHGQYVVQHVYHELGRLRVVTDVPSNNHPVSVRLETVELGLELILSMSVEEIMAMVKGGRRIAIISGDTVERTALSALKHAHHLESSSPSCSVLRCI